MKKLISNIIPLIKSLLIYLENKCITNSGSNTTPSLYSLAPKIITEEKELESIKPYLESLKKAIDIDEINNIAITGSYGSGKSTVIRTFQYYHPEYNYLNISLASFKDNKDGTDNENTLERRLEISILQQMFYHVKPSRIPDSRFKRIVNLTKWNLFFQALMFIVWLLCTIIFLQFDFLSQIDPHKWSLDLKFDWISFFLVITILLGIGFFIKSILRILSNSKISKLNIKGELELGEAVDKSVFNQHLEEILYFFEKTRFNVVIIEDVDRFNSTDIFTKLREINILINRSEQISRSIKFVYAIRDDMFNDANERVKFFEFIIPIIPFINPSNAGEQFTKLISELDLKTTLPPDSEFINDVITFIDEIDMRLLINVFQEYQIYHIKLSKKLDQRNLFAIIVYKNMFPKDFTMLAKRSGKLYKVISEKASYIEEITKDIRTNISKIENELTDLENEIVRPIRELRAGYILHILSKIPDFSNFNFDKKFTIGEAVEDANFNLIYSADRIPYNILEYNYSNSYYVKNKQSTINFKSIESEVDKENSYKKREDIINLIYKRKIDELKKSLNLQKEKLRDAEALSLKEIFQTVDISNKLKEFENNRLVRSLLINGYIDESYTDYISHFHGVNMTLEDFSFERNVKSGIREPFEREFEYPVTIIERLEEKYFSRDVILNFRILDCLLLDQSKYKIKLENFIKCISNKSSYSYQFIYEFLKRNKGPLSSFISLLNNYNKEFWWHLKNYSRLEDVIVRKYSIFILNSCTYSTISKIDKFEEFRLYIGQDASFLNSEGGFNNWNTLMEILQINGIKFEYLVLPKEENVFNTIISHNCYLLSIFNIHAIIDFHGIVINKQKFENSILTNIKKINIEPLISYIYENIEEFILNVLIKIPHNNLESEETIVSVLNDSNITVDTKAEFIRMQETKISNLSLIENLINKEISIECDRIEISWLNIFDYYDITEKDDFNTTLIEFLNKPSTYSVLSKSELSTSTGKSSEYIEAFELKLMQCEDLSLDSYRNLVRSIAGSYNYLDFENIAFEKVKILIDQEILSLTYKNFWGLKKSFPSLCVNLIATNQRDFEEKYTELELEESDWNSFFVAEEIEKSYKFKILTKIDSSIITGSPLISTSICNLLPHDSITSLNYELLEALMVSETSAERKTLVLLSFIGDLNNEQIVNLTSLIAENFKSLFIDGAKPFLRNIKVFSDFLSVLKSRKLIRDYKPTSNSEDLKVLTRKIEY